MSKYKETISELQYTGYLNDKHLVRTLSSDYDKSTPEKKAALDKHPLLVLEKISNQEYVNNVKSIKKNLQFIVWLIIINLCAGVIYLYAA